MQKPGTIKITSATLNLSQAERTDKDCHGANHSNSQTALKITVRNMALRFSIALRLCIVSFDDCTNIWLLTLSQQPFYTLYNKAGTISQ